MKQMLSLVDRRCELSEKLEQFVPGIVLICTLVSNFFEATLDFDNNKIQGCSLMCVRT